MEWAERSGATADSWASAGTRNGQGHKMACWAGGMIEPTPRGWMAIGGGASGPWGTAPMLMLNSRGKRFMNEGAIAQMQATCLRQPAGLACYVTDANWAKTLKAAPLDHGAPNFGMQDYWDKIEQDMNNTVSGQANTITIANLAERTQMAGTVYRADTLDELADLLGYKGAAKQNFLDSIAHYNELCYAGVDSDYGKDAPYMVPIDTAPFFGGTSSTGHSSNPMMVTMSGVITDETQNVLNKDWEPIEGLYVAGNCWALERLGLEVKCYLADPRVAEMASRMNITRTQAGIRLATEEHPDALYVFGNAPTALMELCSLMRRGKACPVGVVGAPVGFVNVRESKHMLKSFTAVPKIIIEGRKGGSNLAATIVNAILCFDDAGQLLPGRDL